MDTSCQQFLHRIIDSMRWRLLSPGVPEVSKEFELGKNVNRLGSKYGGKIYLDIYPISSTPTLISGGAGLDISFEIEFASQHNARVILIDPSTFAYSHFLKVMKRGNTSKLECYSEGFLQPEQSYDTTNLDFTRVTFLNSALWGHKERVRLFSPPASSRDPSESVVAIHHNHAPKSNFRFVEAISLLDVVQTQGVTEVSLLKLDVEGAAFEILKGSFRNRIFPIQINVEFDEIHFPGARSKWRINRLRRLLKKYEYMFVARDGSDFLYIHKSNTC